MVSHPFLGEGGVPICNMHQGEGEPRGGGPKGGGRTNM